MSVSVMKVGTTAQIDPWKADQVFSNRNRQKVIESLRARGPCDVSALGQQIEKTTGSKLDWYVIVYHLQYLQNLGIVDSKFQKGNPEPDHIVEYFWVVDEQLSKYLEAWKALVGDFATKVAPTQGIRRT